MVPEMQHYINVGETISKLFHPFAEIVIHDLKSDTIHAIFNPISKRESGDPSYLKRMDFEVHDDLPSIIGPYRKLNYDGRKLKSITLLIKNQAQKTVGLLCINVDVSVFDQYHTILNSFLINNKTQNETLFKNDFYERMHMFVQNYCITNHLNIETLTRQQKKDVIFLLKKEGGLIGKNANHYIARILGISRATVYNYLKEKP